MKTIHKIAVILLAGALTACSDNWDAHYGHQESEVKSDKLQIVNAEATGYLKSETSFSSIYRLFDEAGLIEAMNGREQLFTVLAVKNDNIGTPPTDDMTYLAKSHLSDIAFSPSNLYDGLRILMWNGKYLNVKIEGDDIWFNDAKVQSITKLNDGYLYEVDGYVDSPRSMYEIIENLDDEYSMFREMILSRNEKVFDKESSIPVGINNSGSTVYDSVFVYTNPYFTAAGLDIMSESVKATMLIPSNQLIQSALDEGHAKLNSWGQNRADSILSNWCFQTMFFDKQYTPQDFADNVDLTSVFKKQWRTTVQGVDLSTPISMSNGVAYYVTKLTIPTNVLIFRLKDFYKWYEFLTEADKAKYYVEENLAFNKIETQVAAWSGWPGVFPNIENRVMVYYMADATLQKWGLEFIPYKFEQTSGGGYTAAPYLVPPGEYDLCVGFKEKMGFDLDIYFNDQYIGTITANQTTAHYDRNGQGYPEFYNSSNGASKAGNYDRDGARVGVVTITGTEAVEVKLTLRCESDPNNKVITLHHWCLKPTKNCY